MTPTHTHRHTHKKRCFTIYMERWWSISHHSTLVRYIICFICGNNSSAPSRWILNEQSASYSIMPSYKHNLNWTYYVFFGRCYCCNHTKKKTKPSSWSSVECGIQTHTIHNVPCNCIPLVFRDTLVLWYQWNEKHVSLHPKTGNTFVQNTKHPIQLNV